MIRPLPFSTVLLALAGCSPLHTGQWDVRPAAGPPFDAKTEEDICEAVFRCILDDDGSTLVKEAKVYFLEIRGADPTPQLLSRFADRRPPVKPVSAAAPERKNGVTDRATGERGLILRIDGIVREEDGDSTVRAGYYFASLGAAGNFYKVVRRGDAWMVVRIAPEWISRVRGWGPGSERGLPLAG